MNLFKMLSSFGNLGKIQEEVQKVQSELAQMSFQGRAGGDMVVVEVNGAGQITGCTIDPKLYDDKDRELLEDLVVAAANDALAAAKTESAEIVQKKLAERLDIPDLQGLLGAFIPKA